MKQSVCTMYLLLALCVLCKSVELDIIVWGILVQQCWCVQSMENRPNRPSGLLGWGWFYIYLGVWIGMLLNATDVIHVCAGAIHHQPLYSIHLAPLPLDSQAAPLSPPLSLYLNPYLFILLLFYVYR